MKSITDNIKSIIIVLLVIMLSVLSALRLMKIQVVGDKDITTPVKFSETAVKYTRQVKATRGGIVDYSGNTLITNDARNDIILCKALFPTDLRKGNDTLLVLCKALKEHGHPYKDSLPISADKPYVFTDNKKSAEVIEKLSLNVYATADNCIDKLISDYKIDDSYTDEEKRILAGLRYDMIVKDFAYNIDLVLAEGVDQQTVIDMKELSNFYPGVDAIESSERRIVRGDILPHELGTVGPIYAEEYAELKNQGYALDDIVGKSGIEAALESTLRGHNGEEEITVDNGSVVDVRTIVETESGKTARLTVDGAYQLKLQKILDDFITNFPSINTNPKLKNVKCGAIAVLDAKTGAVKGFANAPTYNLKDYTENYDFFLTEENSPLLNRCTNGLYRPGSTFKTITATAGLNEGIVDANTTFNCHKYFKYHGGDFQCAGFHGNVAIRRAIEVSCNVYFYELADRLGIDKITEYAKLYGLGQHTGLETGDAAGYLCNPETFAEHGLVWYIGYVLQAAIGNQDAGMTPLQMAVVANTIANRGVRYKPYIVDGLYDYGSGKLVSQTEPTVAQTIDIKNKDMYDLIIGGMIDASHNNMPPKYSLSDLGFDVAIKTGTPQTGKDLEEQNSFFIGFAPADNPEVAFAGVIEGGEYSKYMIRDIILAYQECYGLNGKKPTAKLPAENRKPLVKNTTTTTTTSTTTTQPAEEVPAIQIPDNNNDNNNQQQVPPEQQQPQQQIPEQQAQQPEQQQQQVPPEQQQPQQQNPDQQAQQPEQQQQQVPPEQQQSPEQPPGQQPEQQQQQVPPDQQQAQEQPQQNKPPAGDPPVPE